MKKTVLAIAVLLVAALMLTGAVAAEDADTAKLVTTVAAPADENSPAPIGGSSGIIHIHTNVPGAKVDFFLIDMVKTGQPVSTQYADANGDVYFTVYSTATPPRFAVVTAPGYIQDITSQATLEAPGNGETLTYNIPLTPISPTPLPTETPKSPAPMLAIIAALGVAGAVAALRRN